MGYARMSITNELLIQALALPVDTRILGAEMSDDAREIILYVAHPDLQEHVIAAQGDLPPLVWPSFRRQPAMVFEKWGQD